MPITRAVSPASALLAAALLTIPHRGIAQVPQHAPKAGAAAPYPRGSTRLRLWRQSRLRSLAAPSVSAAPAATVTESEPNDSVKQADLVTVGDTASGAIAATGDVDYYAVDLTAGTTIEFDVFAGLFGSSLDPTLTLVGTDSTTVLAFNDDWFDTDSHIEYTVTATGRYFVAVSAFGGAGDPAFTYSLLFAAPGPGDVTTLYASGLGAPYGMAAGSAGETYVTDVDSLRLLRIAPTGQVTTFATFQGEVPVGVVVDGLGDVLVSTLLASGTAGEIVRLSGGQRSTFASDLSSGGPMTVGPDGDVWVIDPIAAQLRRYDPVGGAKDTVDLSTLANLAFEMGLAFSPAGDLYLSDGFQTIYKVVAGVPQPVLQTYQYLEGLAFDKDGYLYVVNGFLGRVILFDPTLHQVNDPFARRNIGGPSQLVFLRDAGGAMTSRLLADNVGYNLDLPYLGGMVEMNPTAMRAAGFRVGIDLLRVANATLKDGIMGGDYADTLRLVSTPGTTTWSLFSGALPPGLTLSNDGRLEGIPAQAGAFTFAVRADAGGQYGLKSYTVTVSIPTVSVDAASQHLLGGNPLDIALQRYLDLQGNNNGHYDVGDFRAFLRANGQLPATAVAGKEQP